MWTLTRITKSLPCICNGLHGIVQYKLTINYNRYNHNTTASNGNYAVPNNIYALASNQCARLPLIGFSCGLVLISNENWALWCPISSHCLHVCCCPLCLVRMVKPSILLYSSLRSSYPESSRLINSLLIPFLIPF